MEQIRMYLQSPNENKDSFSDTNSVIWIDWKDFDEDIIATCNHHLPKESQIDFIYQETEKGIGYDILLKKNGICTPIPYTDALTARDTTLKSIQKYIAPTYEIRWYMDSLGSDTLGFCILPYAQWQQLEDEFGVDFVTYYFYPIKDNIDLFALDIDDVFQMIERREAYKKELDQLRFEKSMGILADAACDLLQQENPDIVCNRCQFAYFQNSKENGMEALFQTITNQGIFYFEVKNHMITKLNMDECTFQNKSNTFWNTQK